MKIQQIQELTDATVACGNDKLGHEDPAFEKFPPSNSNVSCISSPFFNRPAQDRCNTTRQPHDTWNDRFQWDCPI